VSYCNRASCLAHRRAMYWNLQEGRWVHADGWPCEAEAELAERAERQARADQAFYDEGPREPYVSATCQANQCPDCRDQECTHGCHDQAAATADRLAELVAAFDDSEPDPDCPRQLSAGACAWPACDPCRASFDLPAALAALYEPCPVCAAPLGSHVGLRPCLPPQPAAKPRGLYDLPIFGWAWREGRDR
jgi:hypothetical protein